MPTEVEATYRVVTPMFCAGTNPALPEVRVPSFKGILRFWWRALAWQRLNGNLHAIRNEEDALFGSAGSGQSAVTLCLDMAAQPTVIPQRQVLTTSAEGRGPVGEGARYLGYGIVEAFPSRNRGTRAGELTRACLQAPFEFTVRARGRRLSGGMLEGLQGALVAAGVFGGMGARSRRGYGSLNLHTLRADGEERWRTPRDASEFASRIAALCGCHSPGKPGHPEFTAFSPRARHLLLESDSRECMVLLDLVGRELVRYRSWGHGGQVLGQQSEQNFRDDHDLMKSSTRDRHPRRIAFGLPHNYGRGSAMQVEPYGKAFDRRASPLFIHVHQCGHEPVAVLSLLPARFLPVGTPISVGGQRTKPAPLNELYGPLHEFLDRLLDPDRRREPLRATEVKV